MRVLIVFGTTEGHTRRIADYMMRVLDQDGQQVTVEEAPASEPYPDLLAYDVVIVAGSLHLGRYQRNLVEFARPPRAAAGSGRRLRIGLAFRGRRGSG